MTSFQYAGSYLVRFQAAPVHRLDPQGRPYKQLGYAWNELIGGIGGQDD